MGQKPAQSREQLAAPKRRRRRRGEAHDATLYHQFAHLYDRFFAPVYVRGLRQAVKSLGLPKGARVLELGVGTGLSLEAYPAHVEVVGIDFSSAMLEEAQRRVDRAGITNIRLVEMSACDLKLPDSWFDYVMAFHVVTVVPEADLLMREAVRVLKPGGRLVVVNRFRRERGLMSRLERYMEPIWKRFGWKTLSRRELLEGHPVDVLHARKESPASLFTTIVASNRKNGTPAAHEGNGSASHAGASHASGGNGHVSNGVHSNGTPPRAAASGDPVAHSFG